MGPQNDNCDVVVVFAVLDVLKMGPIRCPETSSTSCNLQPITSLKNEGPNYTAEEAWNLAICGCRLLILQSESNESCI